MKLTVNLVTYNGSKYIPYLVKSLVSQTYKEFFLNIWDNASEDNTVSLLKSELYKTQISYNLVESDQNLGFAGGHNQLYKLTEGKYMILLNQDMFLLEECFNDLVKLVEEDEKIGSASGVLMRWDFEKVHGDERQGFTNIIDSTGLKKTCYGAVKDIKSSETWEKSKEVESLVFGISGALPIINLKAARHVQFSKDELFDNWYFSYKEDVDLAYRLSLAGYKSKILQKKTAYHDRTIQPGKEKSDFAAKLSYRNHLATLYKNISTRTLLIFGLLIFLYEFAKAVYWLIFKPKVLTSWQQLWRYRKELRKKRRFIRSMEKIV